MQIRRSFALLSGALLLMAPLASCGFDPSTGEINNIAQGTSDRDGTVDVLNALVVSAEEGSGVFVATLVNNDLEQDASLDGLSADAEGVQVGEFSGLTIDAGGLVNLAADDQGIPVEGDVAAGTFIPMTLQLSEGQVVDARGAGRLELRRVRGHRRQRRRVRGH